MVVCGNVNEGIHAIRLCDVAVVDVAVTALAAYMLSPRIGHPFSHTFVGLVVLGVVVHRVLGINTTLNKFVFGIV